MSSHRRPAWLVAIATNIVGGAYFAHHQQPGLVVLELTFIAINAVGWHRWRPAPTLAQMLDHHAPQRSAVVRAQRAAAARHASGLRPRKEPAR